MLFPIEDREDLEKLNGLVSLQGQADLEKLNGLVSLQGQAKAVRLQDKLGKQNFHEDMKKIFEPVTKSLESTPQAVTKTITESSINNNKAIENLNEKILELMNDKGMIAPYLASSLVNLFST